MHVAYDNVRRMSINSAYQLFAVVHHGDNVKIRGKY